MLGVLNLTPDRLTDGGKSKKKDKEDIKVEDNDKGSALSSLGLKPKIVH